MTVEKCLWGRKKPKDHKGGEKSSTSFDPQCRGDLELKFYSIISTKMSKERIFFLTPDEGLNLRITEGCHKGK